MNKDKETEETIRSLFSWTVMKQYLWIPAAVSIICIFILCIAATAHADVLTVARKELGHGEQVRNNCGPDIQRYTGAGDGISWCAAFVSYVFREAGYELPTLFRARSFLKYGERVEDPRPGDVIVFWRESRQSWKGHVGIIEKVTNKEIVTIEGNKGKFPAVVKRFTYKRNAIPRFLGFVRMKEMM